MGYHRGGGEVAGEGIGQKALHGVLGRGLGLGLGRMGDGMLYRDEIDDAEGGNPRAYRDHEGAEDETWLPRMESESMVREGNGEGEGENEGSRDDGGVREEDGRAQENGSTQAHQSPPPPPPPSYTPMYDYLRSQQLPLNLNIQPTSSPTVTPASHLPRSSHSRRPPRIHLPTEPYRDEPYRDEPFTIQIDNCPASTLLESQTGDPNYAAAPSPPSYAASELDRIQLMSGHTRLVQMQMQVREEMGVWEAQPRRREVWLFILGMLLLAGVVGAVGMGFRWAAAA